MSLAILTNTKITPKSGGGIRIVDNNQNKRVSDIFHTKAETSYQNSQVNRMNKSRMIEVTERLIDEKMRQKTPFRAGQRNEEYIPQHLNCSIDYTERNYTLKPAKINRQNSLTDLRPKDNYPQRFLNKTNIFNEESKTKFYQEGEKFFNNINNLNKVSLDIPVRTLKKSSSDMLSHRHEVSFHVNI